MSSLQPAYPEKISINYERSGSDAIPMPMDSGIPIPMGQADVYDQPIQMSMQDNSQEWTLVITKEVESYKLNHAQQNCQRNES